MENHIKSNRKNKKTRKGYRMPWLYRVLDHWGKKDPLDRVLGIIFIGILLTPIVAYFTKKHVTETDSVAQISSYISAAALFFLYFQIKEGRQEKELMISPKIIIYPLPLEDLHKRKIFVYNAGLGNAFNLYTHWKFPEDESIFKKMTRIEIEDELDLYSQSFDCLKINSYLQVAIPIGCVDAMLNHIYNNEDKIKYYLGEVTLTVFYYNHFDKRKEERFSFQLKKVDNKYFLHAI